MRKKSKRHDYVGLIKAISTLVVVMVWPAILMGVPVFWTTELTLFVWLTATFFMGYTMIEYE